MLNPITTNLWELNHPLGLAGIQIGHRMTIIRLSSGDLLVHSPVRLSEPLAQELQSLGPVSHIVAPSRMHDLYLSPWSARYPDAAFYCAPGLEQDHPELKFQRILSDQTPLPWTGEIKLLLVQGMPRVNEVVFLHIPSRSLIIADLAFNLGPPMPLFSRLFWKMNGAYQRFTPTKLFKSCIKDKNAFRASLDQILSWNFDRIMVGHGSNVETGGPAALRSAYAGYNTRV